MRITAVSSTNLGFFWMALASSWLASDPNFFVYGYPNGAGGCDGGKAAVEGEHLENNPKTGSLDDGGFGFYIQNVLVDPEINLDLMTNKTYTVAVKANSNATSDATFKGVLIRVQGKDIELEPAEDDEKVKVAPVCDDEDDAHGITHTDRSDKSAVSAILIIGAEQDLLVDVTVVVSVEGSEGSVYYYTGYKLINAVNEFDPNVTVATAVPTSAPGDKKPSPTTGNSTVTPPNATTPTNGTDSNTTDSNSTEAPDATFEPTTAGNASDAPIDGETLPPSNETTTSPNATTEVPMEEETEAPAKTSSPKMVDKPTAPSPPTSMGGDGGIPPAMAPVSSTWSLGSLSTFLSGTGISFLIYMIL